MHRYRSTRRDSPFSRHFLKAMVHSKVSVSDQDPALTVRIRDFNRRFGGLQVSPRLRFACCRRGRPLPIIYPARADSGQSTRASSLSKLKLSLRVFPDFSGPFFASHWRQVAPWEI